MNTNKNKVFPVFITVVIIAIMIYLFANIKQPYVVCNKTSTNDLGILVKEKVESQLGSNKIKMLEVTRTIILPKKYLEEDTNNIDSIQFALEQAYQYLGEGKVQFTKESDRLIVKISVSKDETIILNNLEFVDESGLVLKVNSNTKSSDVVTLKINDKYTEGTLMTRMKNNGYLCN